MQCGSKVLTGNSICADCLDYGLDYTLASVGYYVGGLRTAVRSLKYRRNLGLGIAFGELIGQLFISKSWAVDLVVPVPLARARLSQRGYNQSAIFAYPFSLSLGLTYSSKVIKRVRDTQSQINLSRDERLQNVSGAFLADRSGIEAKNILLLDDVATTGATIKCCAEALYDAGASYVYALTVAKTP
jgi:ComF family protein